MTFATATATATATADATATTDADRRVADAVDQRGAGQLRAARRAFERMVAERPDDPALRIELAVTCAWSSDLPCALSNYRAALVLAPSSSAARNGVARIQGWTGHEIAAMTGFRRSLVIDPNDLEATLGLAALYRARWEISAARHTYTRALALAPNNPDAIAGLAALSDLRAVAVRATVQAAVVGDLTPHGGLLMSWRRSRRWTVVAGVGTVDIGQPLDPIIDDSARAEVGAQWRSERSAIAVGFEGGWSDGAHFGGTTWELGRRLGPIALSTAGRVRCFARRCGDLLSLGGDLAIVDRMFVGARGFVAIADSTAAAVVQVGWRGPRLQTHVEGSFARFGQYLDGVGAAISFDPGHRWAVAARVNQRAIPSLTVISSDVTVRF
jgi:Flp pilus assembly protein TadD